MNNSSSPNEALEGLLQALSHASAQGRAGSPGLADAGLAERLQRSILAEVKAFTNSANPQIDDLLQRHLQQLELELQRLLRGEPLPRFGFVEEFAKRTAEQYFPLEALLHAYRVCLKVLLKVHSSDTLDREGSSDPRGAAALTEFLLEYIDAVSRVATEHHVDQSRLLADVASDQRSEMLATLLGGYDESDRRITAMLRDAGYFDRRLAYCVILVQSIDPAEMNNAARARRLADYIDRLLKNIPGKRLVDLHRSKVTIVFSHLRRLSGWSEPQAALAARAAQELAKVGTAARAGISNDVASTSQIPAAYQQAELAFNLSNIGNRVVQFSEIPLQRLLYHFAGDAFIRVLPGWAQSFYDADARAKGRLARTLEAFAGANMNVLKTALQLRVHPNTVYARFRRIRSLTERDPRIFHQLNELLIITHSQGLTRTL